MKLQFDAGLEYQAQAVSSVVDLFRGQTPNKSNFTVTAYAGQVGMQDTENGVGNKLDLDSEDMLENLQAVQLRGGLPQSKAIAEREYDFDIEMETGTGKTYVYLRTVFELNKAYGFSKFIIVVPSLAIKEGVYKSLQITGEHFRRLYPGVIYDYFIYDSNKLEQVRSFAVADTISIMVINIDAFRKSFTDDPEKETRANIIHRQRDTLNGMRPIELIRETNPFVIIDEPQSVDTTPKSAEAINSLNPLCIFRYSATHVRKHNLVYKLDAVDAFDLELVKQIEVAGFAEENHHNSAYMCLKSVDNKKSPITAKIELDVQEKSGSVKKKVVTARQGDDLRSLSKGRAIYADYIVDDIYCEKDNEYVSFTTKPEILRLNQPVGGVDELAIKEQQIRKTIQEHLEKELVLRKQEVKVLSLFFIDRVANYRQYNDEGNAVKGIYAQLFEKHYAQLIRQPKYALILNGEEPKAQAQQVHDGYFSADKKKTWKDTNGATAADDDAYSLIMKDKEKLLSFDTQLRFIFSHSALREGWDNPNVFQICTLNETGSEVKKRQEIGRGLRLCVNQQGERLHGFSVNTLTVMANESYESFAANLQREYEQEQGIRFGFVESHSFANIAVKQPDGTTAYLGMEKSEQVYSHFETMGYIDKTGKVQEKMQNALKANLLELPANVEDCRADIEVLCKKISRGVTVRNSDDKRKVELNKGVFLHPDFKERWERIKYKTTYSVDFSTDALVASCVDKMKGLVISTPKLTYRKARVNVDAGGVTATETNAQAVASLHSSEGLPDIITYLQNRTNLTRKTIVDILVQSQTLNSFFNNPQLYMEEVAKIITNEMKLLLVDGIKYTKIGRDSFYAQELFEKEELSGYLHKNMMESKRGVFEYVVYDSEVERGFAEGLENNDNIKLYAKLPDWFKVPTPLGNYNPDWAVLAEVNGEEKLYFVVETKGNVEESSLRPTESKKIECGKKHFAALDADVACETVSSFEMFRDKYISPCVKVQY